MTDDDFDGYSASDIYPPFPGEDFLMNAPSGLMFPTDLSGATAVPPQLPLSQARERGKRGEGRGPFSHRHQSRSGPLCPRII